jgi:hypothetical protein
MNGINSPVMSALREDFFDMLMLPVTPKEKNHILVNA